jgi:hypothetical protein
MIGDIVGRSDEVIKCEDQRAMPRMDDPRRDRKILVAVALAGSPFARVGHLEGWLCCFGALHASNMPPCFMELKPHIGEYATKTNAIRKCGQSLPRPANGGRQAFEPSF